MASSDASGETAGAGVCQFLEKLLRTNRHGGSLYNNSVIRAAAAKKTATAAACQSSAKFSAR